MRPADCLVLSEVGTVGRFDCQAIVTFVTTSIDDGQ